MTDKTFEKYKAVIDEYLVNGGNGRKAYQKLYPKSSDETAEQRFSKLSRIYKVKSYLNSKQQETSTELQITFESQLLDLEWVKDTAKEKQSLSDYVNALKEQNKMLGHYAPDRVDHTTKGESLNKTIELPDGENWNDLKNQIRQIDNE